jgi:hypothetical protein
MEDAMKKAKRDWSRIIAAQATSGKSVQEYCRGVGVHPNTFYKKRKVEGHPAMVEIRPSWSRKVTSIVVNIRQYSVTVGSGFDPQCLKAVLQVIGELQ